MDTIRLDKDKKSKLQLLSQRILQLKKANITLAELDLVAKMSTAELEKISEPLATGTFVPEPSNPSHQAVVKLFNLLKDESMDLISDASKLEEAILTFEEDHGDYVCLLPLSVHNLQSTANYLNDFALFAKVFVPHVSVSEKVEDADKFYQLGYDLIEAKQTWLNWKETRPIRLAPSVVHGSLNNAGIMEKFLAGALKPQEWLTDLDIERCLRVLDLNKYGVHVIPFKVDDMGLAFHFEREKHSHDDPKKPYTISLILNLGEDDHSRIDSRGVHWTRLLVNVDPSVEPPTIAVDYTDSLHLAPQNEAKIRETITKALNYRIKLGGYSSTDQQKQYVAYPDYTLVNNAIKVTSSAEQVDGFTCGYRALKGIVSDLVNANVLPANTYTEFLNCDSVEALRNFIYTKLLVNQIVPKAEFEQLKNNPIYKKAEAAFTVHGHDQYKIKPNMVKGQLFAFETPAKQTKLKSNLPRVAKNPGVNPDALERLAQIGDLYDSYLQRETLKAIINSKEEKLSINFQTIFTDLKVSNGNESESEAAINAIFKAISNNSNIKGLELNGVETLAPELLDVIKEELDHAAQLTDISSTHVDLKEYSKILSARNILLSGYNRILKSNEDPWDALFSTMLLDLPETPSGETFHFIEAVTAESFFNQAVADFGDIGLEKLFSFLASKELEIKNSQFPYTSFSMRNAVSAPENFAFGLSTLKKHLQSDTPYLPFKNIILGTKDLRSQANLLNELKEILPLLNDHAIDTLELVSNSDVPFTVDDVEQLVQIAINKNITSQLLINADVKEPQVKNKLIQLENVIANNQRKKNVEKRVVDQQQALGIVLPSAKQQIKLGRIGEAIFGKAGMRELDAEVSNQEQQQMEQQAQTAIENNNIPDEKPVADEAFIKFSGNEELVDRSTIEAKLGKFISERYPNLKAEDCWDLIVGKNANHFKYGIKKLTISAAKQIIENLSDYQYGISLDNPPKGFYPEQSGSDLVLCYNPFSPRINPNESPLTIKNSKPMLGASWHGDISQFLSQEKINEIFKADFEKLEKKDKKARKDSKYSLEKCSQHFFYLKDLEDPNITNSIRKSVFNALIESLDPKASEIQEQINTIFGADLSDRNIIALSEILYAEGVGSLKSLLSDLHDIKKFKGDDFFASFKKCFIDPSENLRELLTENSKQAVKKLLSLSKAEAKWWQSLTEQHSSNIKLKAATDDDNPEKEKVGERWANFSDLIEGFTYFIGELTEIDPTLSLPEKCPLQNVVDMRSGLDRLLTILRNAHDLNEQFYSLEGLSLDALGPYYASRYEGYKIVTAEMMLELGQLLLDYSKKQNSDSIKEEQIGCEPECSYRFGKRNIGSNFGCKTANVDPTLQFLLRYVATFNHRGPLQLYKDMYEKVISHQEINTLLDDINKSLGNLSFNHHGNIMVLLTAFTSGKRGKHFTLKDVDDFLTLLANIRNNFQHVANEDRRIGDIASQISMLTKGWRELYSYPVKPTVSEIVLITEALLKLPSPQPQAVLFTFSPLISSYKDQADIFINALSNFSKNPNGLDFNAFINDLELIEQSYKLKSNDRKIAYFSDNLTIRVNITRVLAVVSRGEEVVANESYGDLIPHLYEAITRFNKFGQELTLDLLQLLGNIDVVTSTKLPTLKEMTALIDDCTTLENLNFSKLHAYIKERLPEGCIIGRSNTETAVLPAATGDLYSTISKHMREIIDQLKPYKFAVGTEKFKELEGPNGARILIDSLAELKDNSQLDMFAKGVKPTVIKVMRNVYKEALKDNISKIILSPGDQAKLLKVVNENITHPNSTEDNFAKFSDSFSGELKNIEQFCGHLRHINEKWPKKFGELIDILEASTSLKDFSLDFLVFFTKSFEANFNSKQAFPLNIFRLFLDFKSADKALEDKLNSILERVIAEDQKLFSTLEKQLVSELVLKHLQENVDANTETLLNKLTGLKQNYSDLFVEILNLMKSLPKPDMDKLVQIEKLVQLRTADAKIKHNLLVFLADSKHISSLDTVIEFVNSPLNATPKKIEQILSIAIKAASGDHYSHENVEAIIDGLKTKSEKEIEQLFDLYNLPPFPSAAELLEELKKPNVSFEMLTAKYDLDPWGNRSDPDRCELFLMSTPAIEEGKKAYKQSDRKHLYLYKDKDNDCFYYIADDRKKYFLKGNVKDALQNAEFNQLGNNPTKCEVKEIRDVVLKITSERDHTDLDFLQEQFSTKKVPDLIDNLRDLNNDRPLLFSQRQQLYRWFLYINAIGKDFGIRTNPNDEASIEHKPIKDLTHAEISHLLQYYRDKIDGLPEDKKIRAKLEYIAIAREVMYRTTGRFPYPTQILYLLTAMLSGKDFIGQIQTGQGKSLTAALAASLYSLEGKTVDICTSNLFLADEGLEENKAFFEYMGIKAKLIDSETSNADDYQKGNIHYSSTSEMSLYRSKMELEGKIFPEDAVLFLDEVDYVTSDDDTRYRYAVNLDPVTDAFVSPYVWVYEALITFIDSIKNQPALADTNYIEAAKKHLRLCAKTKVEKESLKHLEDTPDLYEKRLETWLIAAAKTATLVDLEEVKFRVIEVKQKQYGEEVVVSKACLLKGDRPNIRAELSNSVQQFLHVRLRKKYAKEIEAGEMPNFNVEPEKSYITSYNSKLLLNRYLVRLGMSGTAGSEQEIKEHFEKYGFYFVDIPPYQESQRQDLKPILTNSRLVKKPDLEDVDHVNKIVKEILHHLSSVKPPEMPGPILISCENKPNGNKIKEALEIAMNKNRKKYGRFLNSIQEFYSSEKSTPQERNDEEREKKEQAGKDGIITISSVFDRGTDIKPTNKEGLYVIQTYVDTAPYSSEDLERAKRQKFGRAGRQGQPGKARLIIKRSQFAPVYKNKQLRNIPQTIKGVDKAIKALNAYRNISRTRNRLLREYFDDVKDQIYLAFFNYIEVINSKEVQEKNLPTKSIRERLLKYWNEYTQLVDRQWKEAGEKESIDESLADIAKFACAEWDKLKGILDNEMNDWMTRTHAIMPLPTIPEVEVDNILEKVKAKHPSIRRYYIKEAELIQKLDPNLPAEAVYCDFMSDPNLVQNARGSAVNQKVKEFYNYLRTEAHQHKLKHLNLCVEEFDSNNVVKHTEEAVAAYLYLTYKSFCAGNTLGIVALRRNYRELLKWVTWSQDDNLKKAVSDQLAAHYKILTAHVGQHETKKASYLRIVMGEASKLLPAETKGWMQAQLPTIWEENLLPNITKWLSSYKDKWWTRGWVSHDRKQVVERLLTDLNDVKANDAVDKTKILNAINEARSTIIVDDLTKDRKMEDGLDGRLNKYLNETRAKILSGFDAASLDSLVRYEFEDIKKILLVFQQRISHKAGMEVLAQQLYDAIALLSISDLEDPQDPNFKLSDSQIYKQYQVLLKLFTQVESLANDVEELSKSDVRSLYRFCSDKRKELVRYFKQCDVLKAINTQGSVEVFRAANEAAVNVVKTSRFMTPKPELPELGNGFTYLDDKVVLENKIDQETFKKLSRNHFFNLMTNISSYGELLAQIEQSIVEKRQDKTSIQYDKITLDKTDKFPEGFLLTVDLSINEHATKIAFHFNCKDGTVYTDYDTTAQTGLDKLSAKTYKPALTKRPDVLERYRSKLNQSQLLIKETEKVLHKFDKEKQQAIKTAYGEDCILKNAAKKPVLDFDEFLKNYLQKNNLDLVIESTGPTIKT